MYTKTPFSGICSCRSNTVHPEGYPMKENLIFARKIQFCWLVGESVRVKLVNKMATLFILVIKILQN